MLEEAPDAENSGNEANPRADDRDKSDDDDNDGSHTGEAGAVSRSPSSAYDVGAKDNQSNKGSSNETRDGSSGQGQQSASEASTSNHNNLSGTLVVIYQRNVRHKKKGTDDAMIDALCEPLAKASDPATQISIQDHAARVDRRIETGYANGDSANPGVADTGAPKMLDCQCTASSRFRRRRLLLPRPKSEEEVGNSGATALLHWQHRLIAHRSASGGRA
jgi:hypothetical protein